MVTGDERDYLLAEFSESFQHMGKLDDRRYEILQFYATFITAVATAVIAIVSLDILDTTLRLAGAAMILTVSAGVSWAMGQVLVSERRATERYRNKLNAIRRALLDGTQSPEIQRYLKAGTSISISLESVESKDLHFIDIAKKLKRCTALYIKVLIDVGMWASVAGAVILALIALGVL